MHKKNIDKNVDFPLEEDKDLDEKLFHYYEHHFHSSKSIDPVQKVKLMVKIYKYHQGHNGWKNIWKTVSVASLIGISVLLFSKFTLETKIEQQIDIID